MKPFGVGALLVVGTLLLSAMPASAAIGSPFGARVQWVATQVKEKDVAIVNCLDFCLLTWESLGHSKLTLRCLDGTNETSVAIFGVTPPPSLHHPCVLESTLELHEATESVVLWRANICRYPECVPA
jgi:hypothetical protein